MTKKPLIALIMLCVGLMLAGCHPSQKLVTTTLTPSRTWTPSREHYSAQQIACLMPCGVGGVGRGCRSSADLATDAVRVGFENVYNPGTKPCACWSSSDCIYRGYVKFDLGSLPSKKVVSAKLLWKATTSRKSTKVATNVPTCLHELFVAGAPWKKFNIPGQQISGQDFYGGSYSIQVGPTVRDWVSGKVVNNGWFFVGPNESLKGKDNDYCLGEASHLRLEVTTAVK